MLFVLTPLLKKEMWLFSRNHIHIHKWSDDNCKDYFAKLDVIVAYLEMFVPLFLNQRIVLNCDSVPHVVFLKNVFSTNWFQYHPTLSGRDIDPALANFYGVLMQKVWFKNIY